MKQQKKVELDFSRMYGFKILKGDVKSVLASKIGGKVGGKVGIKKV